MEEREIKQTGKKQRGRGQQRIKALIFDFDDTIEDFAGAQRYAFPMLSRMLFARYGIYGPTMMAVLSEVDYKYTHLGISKQPKYFDRHVWAKEFFRRMGIKPKKRDVELFVRMYWKLISAGAKRMPHAAEVLAALRRKYLLALMSDSDGKKSIKEARVRKLGLMRHFDILVTSDDSGQNKPSRKMYAIVSKKLGVKPAECAMIGDKPIVDLELAKRMGMKTVWMKHGTWARMAEGRRFRFVDHEITDLRQLLRIF